MPVRTAIIPAAGLGTRFLPASKAVPKELVTVVDRPIIQYGVEELVRAGVKNICIITSEGKEGLINHFSSNSRLETALGNAGKHEILDKMQQLNSLAEITSVVQEEPRGLGHAVWVARDVIDDEPFVVLLPDELLDPAVNFLGEMIDTFDVLQKSVIAVAEVPHRDVGSYGVIQPDDGDGEVLRVRSVVEKPRPESAPSNLAVIGRYVLVPEVMGILGRVEPGAGGEIQLTDALAVLAGRGELYAQVLSGRRWDAGTKQGYLEATAALALEHPELGQGFRNYLETIRAG
ncbi:MAG: UTP--glucose-1-phosphate uridylyltransferase [Actinomycetota bacterium]